MNLFFRLLPNRSAYNFGQPPTNQNRTFAHPSRFKKDLMVLLCLIFSYTFLCSQAYIHLEHYDAVASTISPGRQSDLESASQEVIEVLPASDRSKFKIYDAGFYLHHAAIPDGPTEAWGQIVNVVESDPNSDYYLLFGRESNSTGVNIKVRVKLKLPETPAYSCLTAEERKNLEKYVEQAANEELASGYAKAEIEALSFFRKSLHKVIACNCSNVGVGCNFMDIDLQLLALGFRKKAIELGGPAVGGGGGILDYKQRKVIIDGIEYDIAEQVSEGKAIIGGNGRVYILDNESFVNGEWENAQAQSNVLDYVEYWVVLTDGDNKSFLYSRFTIGDFSPARPSDGTQQKPIVAISPWGLALKALGNAALDAVLQAAAVRIIDEKATDMTYAWGQVSYLGAAWEGLSSLIPWKEDLKTAIIRSAASAFATVFDKAFNQPGYTVEEGIRDFAISFAASGLTQLITHRKVVETIGMGKYAENVFKNGLDRVYFSSTFAPLKRVMFLTSTLFDNYFVGVVRSAKYLEQNSFITGVKKIDLMGGKKSQMGGDFVNIDYLDKITNGIQGDATKLSRFVPANSVDEIVCNNPYLGSGTAADYIKEIAVVMKSGKKVYVNGTKGNPFYNKVTQSLAANHGFTIEALQQPLLSQFSGLKFFTSQGAKIEEPDMLSTVLVKQ